MRSERGGGETGDSQCIAGVAIADHHNRKIFCLEGRDFLAAEDGGVQDTAVVDFARAAGQGLAAPDAEIDRELARAVGVNRM